MNYKQRNGAKCFIFLLFLLSYISGRSQSWTTMPTSNCSTTTCPSIGITGTGGAALQIKSDNTSPIYFYTNGNTTPRLRIDANGNVGIGVATASTITFPLSFGPSAVASQIALYENGASKASIGYSNSSNQFAFYKDLATLMSINANGSTTIYLKSNDGSFMVDAGSNVAPLIGLKNASSNGWIFMGIASGAGSYSSVATKANDVVLSNRSNALVSNFVITNQSYQASILFATKDIPNSCCSGDKQRMEIRYDGKVVIGNNAVDGNNLATSINEFVTAGNPGATFPGDYRLYVAKGIMTPKLKVAIPGPKWFDFVFEDDYKLRPLAEVEQYVKENKHLPDVPSEEEVKREGIDVASMQGVMLQKIEELTLYVIQLEKEMKELKSKRNK